MKKEDYNRYKLGALKRKFKTGVADQEPGTFIAKANEVKRAPITKKTKSMSRSEKVAIMGAV